MATLPAFREGVAASIGVSATAGTVSLASPAGVSEIALAAACWSKASDIAVAPSAGWSLVAASRSGNANLALYASTRERAVAGLTLAFSESVSNLYLALVAYGCGAGRAPVLVQGSIAADGNSLNNYGLRTITPTYADSLLVYGSAFAHGTGSTLDGADADVPNLRASVADLRLFDGEAVRGQATTLTTPIVETGQKLWSAFVYELRLVPYASERPAGGLRPSRVCEDPRDRRLVRGAR